MNNDSLKEEARCWIFHPAEDRARRGRPPACPPAGASVMLLASAKLKDTWCHVLFSKGAWRLSVTVRASVLYGLSQTGFNVPLQHTHTHTVPPHVNNPSVCDCVCVRSERDPGSESSTSTAAVGRPTADTGLWVCALSLSLSASFPTNPASSSSMFPWNRPVIFTAVSRHCARASQGKREWERVREGLAKGFQMSRGYSTALLILRQDSNQGNIQATAKCISILGYTCETSVNYMIVIKHILDLQHGPYSHSFSHYVYCFENSPTLPQMNQIIREFVMRSPV